MAAPAEPAEIRRRPTSINGVEVIEVEQAMVPHPYYGENKLVVQEGAGKALLADNTEVYYCDDCDYSAVTVTSVRSHRSGTHNRTEPAGPRTPVKSIRAAIRAVEAARANGVKGYCRVAAQALNAAGVSTGSGKPWTDQSVSQIYNHYRERYPVRVRRTSGNQGTPALTVVPTPAAQQAATVELDDPVALRAIAEAMVSMAAVLQKVASNIEAAPAVDPELAEKARKWDELRGLIT